MHNVAWNYSEMKKNAEDMKEFMSSFRNGADYEAYKTAGTVKNYDELEKLQEEYIDKPGYQNERTLDYLSEMYLSNPDFQYQGGEDGYKKQIAIRNKRGLSYKSNVAALTNEDKWKIKEFERLTGMQAPSDPSERGIWLNDAIARYGDAVNANYTRTKEYYDAMRNESSDNPYGESYSAPYILEGTENMYDYDYIGLNIKWNNVKNNPDFEERSGIEYPEPKVGPGNISNLYGAINYNHGTAGDDIGDDYETLDVRSMTDEQRKIYNYLYNTEGEKKAREYFDDLRKGYLKDQRNAQKAKQLADRKKFLDSKGLIGDVANLTLDAAITYSDAATALPQFIGGSIASAVGNDEMYEEFTDPGYASDIWGSEMTKDMGGISKFGYNALREAFALISVGKTAKVMSGGNAKKATRINQLFTSSRAANSTLRQYIDSGEDPANAIGMAIVNGSIEWFTERISPLEKYMKNPGVYTAKEKLIEIGKGAGTEAMEEVTANFMTTIAAGITDNNKQDTFLAAFDKGKADGMSDGKAFWNAVCEVIPEYAESALIGGLVGGAFSASNTIRSSNHVTAIRDDSIRFFDRAGVTRTSIQDYMDRIGYVVQTDGKTKMNKNASDIAGKTELAAAINDMVQGKKVSSDMEEKIKSDPTLTGILYGLTETNTRNRSIEDAAKKRQAMADELKARDDADAKRRAYLNPETFSEAERTVYNALGEHVTVKTADNIMNNPELTKVFEKVTGEKLKGTNAQKRATIREYSIEGKSYDVVRNNLNNAVNEAEGGITVKVSEAHQRLSGILEGKLGNDEVRSIINNQKLSTAFEEAAGVKLEGDYKNKVQLIRDNAKSAVDNIETAQESGVFTLKATDENLNRYLHKATAVNSDSTVTTDNVDGMKEALNLIENSNPENVSAEMGSYASKMLNDALNTENKGSLISAMMAKGMSRESAKKAVSSVFSYMYEAGRKGWSKANSIAAVENYISKGVSKDAEAFYAVGVLEGKGTLRGKKNAKVIRNAVLKKKISKSGRLNFDELKAFNQLARLTGCDIEFVEGLKNESGEAVNGLFDAKKGRILIDAECESPYLTAAIHESIHAIREIAPKEYNELKRAVFDLLRGHDELIDEELKKTYDLYLEESDNGANVDYIEEETIARVVSEVLTDKSVVADLIDADKKLSVIIREALAKFFNKLLGRYKGGNERMYTSEAVKLLKQDIEAVMSFYDSALEKTESLRGYKTTFAGEVVEKKSKKGLKNGKRRGKILYEFPPYNKSKSQANEISTRWAHDDDVEEYATRFVSYHGSMYQIEKNSNADMKYRIIKKFTEKQYRKYINEMRRISNEQISETSNNQIRGEALSNSFNDRRKSASSMLHDEYERENGSVHGMVEDEDKRGFVRHEREGDNERGVKDRPDGRENKLYSERGGGRDSLGGRGRLSSKKSSSVKSADNSKPMPNLRSPASHVMTKYALEMKAEVVAKLDEQIKKYGAMEKGVDPARDVTVPNKTSDDKYVRRYARSAAEAELIDNETAEKIMEDIASGEFWTTYERAGNKKAVEAAQAKLERYGYEAMLDNWYALVDSGARIVSQDIVEAQVLLSQAVAQNDTENVARLLADISAEGTRSGQISQALILTKRMGPAAKLTALQRTVDNINRDLIQQRGKKAPEVKVDEKLLEEYTEALNEEAKKKDGNTEKSDAKLEEIYQNVGQQIPGTWVDKLRAWRYFAMLGNLRTHLRNIVGNLAFSPVIFTKNIIASGGEAVASKVLKLFGKDMQRTKSFSGLFARGEVLDFAKNDADAISDVLKGEAKYGASKKAVKHMKVYKHKLPNKLVEGNSNLLEKEDWLFLKPHYARALTQYIKANKLDIDTLEGTQLDKARMYAIREAQRATFREKSKLAEALSLAAHHSKAADFAIESIVPFKKTPINILKQGIRYSPAGIVSTIHTAIWGVKEGNYSAAELIDGLAQNITGTGLMALGAALMSGLFKGVRLQGPGDDDDKKGNYLQKVLGEQSYSLVFADGSSYTIDWLSPAAMSIFVGGEIYNAFTDGGLTLGDTLDIMAKITQPIFEMSMLEGLANLVENASYAQSTPEALASVLVQIPSSYVGQFVPTSLGQLARTIDNTRRRTYIDKNSDVPAFLQSLVQQQMKKIPWLSEKLEPSVNAKGEVQKNAEGNVVMRALQNFLSPGYYKTKKETAVDKELIRLVDTIGEDAEKILPKDMGKEIQVGDETRKLTAKQYTEYQTAVGREYYEQLGDIINSDYYKELSDSDKAKLVKEAYDYAVQVGRKAVFEDYDYGSSQKLVDKFESEDGYQFVITPGEGESGKADAKKLLGDKYGEYEKKYKALNDELIKMSKVRSDDHSLESKYREEVYEYAKATTLADMLGNDNRLSKWQVVCKNLTKEQQAEYIYGRSLMSMYEDGSEKDNAIYNSKEISDVVKIHLVNSGWAEKYTAFCQRYNIAPRVYLAMKQKEANDEFAPIKKTDTSKAVSKKERVCNYINSLAVDNRQKSALFRAMGYSDVKETEKSEPLKYVKWSYTRDMATSEEYEKLVGKRLEETHNWTKFSDAAVGQCVWYVRNRAYSKLGKVTPALGNANEMYNNAKAGAKVEATADNLKGDMLLVYKQGTSSAGLAYGHVIYIEAVEGDTVYYTEGGRGYYDNRTDGILKKSTRENILKGIGEGRTIGSYALGLIDITKY